MGSKDKSCNKWSDKICLNGWNFNQNPSDFVVIEDSSFSSAFVEKVSGLEDEDKDVDIVNDRTIEENEDQGEKLKILEEIKSLEMIFGSNQINSALAFFENTIESRKDKGADDLIFELIPVIKHEDINKEQRTIIHNSIRIIFDNKVDSKTIIDTNSIQLFKKKERKGGPLARWDASKPDYLEFTLIKSLLSTTDAIDRIAKISGHLPTRFAVAGSKDRKAITMQRVSAWRVSNDELMRINNPKSTTLSIRDIQESNIPQKLGNHKGNIFYITLRPERLVSASKSNVDNMVVNHKIEKKYEIEANKMYNDIINLGHASYINYFGSQRFGKDIESNSLKKSSVGHKCSTNTIISKLILKGSHHSFMKAVLFLLMSPQGKGELEIAQDKFNVEILCDWLQISLNPNFEEEEEIIDNVLFLSNLQKKWTNYLEGIELLLKDNTFIKQRYDIISSLLLNEIDTTNISSFNNIPLVQKKILINIMKQLKTRKNLSSMDWRSAFNSIPQKLRLLYINSYQSQLFNLATTNLCTERGFSSLSSSLSTTSALVKEGDFVLLGPNQEPLTAWDVSNRNIIMSASNFYNNDDNEKENSEQIKMNKAFIHRVTKEEEELKLYPLEAAVLPLPGYATLPCDYITQLIDVSNLLTGDHPDKLYRLPGAYRHIITCAKNVHVTLNKSGWKIANKCDYNTNDNNNNLEKFVEEKWNDGSMEMFLGRIHEHDNIRKIKNKKHSLPPILLEQKYLDNTWNKNHIMINNFYKNDSIYYNEEDISTRIKVSFTLCASSYATVWLNTLNLIEM